MDSSNTISIINKNDGMVIGERAQALPVTIKTSFSPLRIFLGGVVIGMLVLVLIFVPATTQVQTVEIVGVASPVPVLELK